MSVMTVDPYEREQAGDTALWIAAALVVAALHVGLVAAYLLLRPAPEGEATAPVIDVAFVPAEDKQSEAVPETRPADPTPKVEQSDAPPPKDESVTEPEPPAKAETIPPPEPVPPPVALQVPEPIPEAVHPDDVTVPPPPPPKPVEQTPQARKPAPERAERKPDEKAEKEKERKQALQKQAAEQQASRRARLAMAPNPGANSEGARAGRASWESEVAARIRSAASYPSGSRDSGTARVGVTIDRNGRLVSRRLAGSSGSSALDGAALAIVARAAPYPRFLPGMTEAQISLTVPLHLHPQ